MEKDYETTKYDLLSLVSCNNEAIKNNIMVLNDKTKEFGLMLTEEQIENLIDTRKYALSDNSLLELGSSILEDIILEFYTSPYISKVDYDETLYELVNIYYTLREKFNYHIPDAYIIKLMREHFDDDAYGSTELLVKLVTNDILKIRGYKYYIGEGMNDWYH